MRPLTTVSIALGALLSPGSAPAQQKPVQAGAPAVSPDGRTIAFTANRDGRYDIWTSDPAGGRERRVTNTDAPERNVGWLASGEMVFSLADGDTSRIFAIHPDGTGQRPLGALPAREFRISPDGQWVVQPEGRFPALRLVVSSLDGSDAHNLTDGAHAAFHPSWSPDGRRIAFSERLGPDTTALAVVEADGSGHRLLGAIPAEEGSVEMPAWSPDGSRIAVQVGRYFQDSAQVWQGIAHIWVVDVASGDAHRLGGHQRLYLDETPAWFPDGQTLAFQSDRTDTMEVWRMRPDGSGLRQVTDAPPENSTPDVSPDGRSIAFRSDRGGPDKVLIIGVDGTGEHLVPGSGAGRPRWAHNGRGLLISGGARPDSGRVNALAPQGGARRPVATAPGRSPVLSPDGRRVAFLIGPWTSTALAVANADGSHVRIIAGGKTTAWNAAWSPDGRRIAYTYGDTSQVLQVHVVNADGTGDHAVTHMSREEGSAQMPAWSPNGRHLAVQVDNARSHTSSIWLVDVTTGEARRLTGHGEPCADEIPAWFPDGRRIAFQSDRTGSMQIWITTIDGDTAVQLTR
jgi:Tol biopolymer transport system component